MSLYRSASRLLHRATRTARTSCTATPALTRSAAAASSIPSNARSYANRIPSFTSPSSLVLDHSFSSQVGPATELTAAGVRNMKGFIVDMDGVLYYQQKLIPGALDFIAWLKSQDKSFLFLTNSSERSPRELQEKLRRLGIEVSADHFYTSALATANFLAKQKPNGSCYVIGEPGLISALYERGFSMNDSNPDYVVVGETRNYNYAMLETAVALVRKGARLIGTNCDIADRSQDSFVPACGSLIKPIELASGRTPYYIGKPNPLIMRAALSKLGVKRTEACIIGDRLDTDILSGVQSEIHTVLVLTGVTSVADVSVCSFRPDCILPSVYHVLTDGHEVQEQPVQQATGPPPPVSSLSRSGTANPNVVAGSGPAASHQTEGETATATTSEIQQR